MESDKHYFLEGLFVIGLAVGAAVFFIWLGSRRPGPVRIFIPAPEPARFISRFIIPPANPLAFSGRGGPLVSATSTSPLGWLAPLTLLSRAAEPVRQRPPSPPDPGSVPPCAAPWPRPRA